MCAAVSRDSNICHSVSTSGCPNLLWQKRTSFGLIYRECVLSLNNILLCLYAPFCRGGNVGYEFRTSKVIIYWQDF